VHILFVETDARFATVLLSHCFRESPLVSGGSQTCYPHICFVGDDDVFGTLTVFNLMADNTDVTSCTDIITAVTACLALYWIFDIQYPKNFMVFSPFWIRMYSEVQCECDTEGCPLLLTRNAWQRLLYSPLGAKASLPSK